MVAALWYAAIRRRREIEEARDEAVPDVPDRRSSPEIYSTTGPDDDDDEFYAAYKAAIALVIAREREAEMEGKKTG